MPGPVERALRERRDTGGKALVVYVTGGLGDDWTDTVRAVADAGADVIEIGVPFSDPVMDGPTIQAANDRALGSGATPSSILNQVRDLDAGAPLAVMTYYNIAFRAGLERFAASLAAAGVSGCILPDLPLEETGPWVGVADDDRSAGPRRRWCGNARTGGRGRSSRRWRRCRVGGGPAHARWCRSRWGGGAGVELPGRVGWCLRPPWGPLGTLVIRSGGSPCTKNPVVVGLVRTEMLDIGPKTGSYVI